MLIQLVPVWAAAERDTRSAARERAANVAPRRARLRRCTEERTFMGNLILRVGLLFSYAWNEGKLPQLESHIGELCDFNCTHPDGDGKTNPAFSERKQRGFAQD